ncbi:MAG: AroM family protein [Firmicutes bacterium]|nr:AroM family protein [Bacillota bacterium]
MQYRSQVALITIGQTPRPDLESELSRLWNNKFEIMQEGALDDLDDAEIKLLEPVPGESDLITRLADGRSVYLSHHRLTPYVQAAIDRACKQGADIIIIACTGGFDELKADVPIIQPCNVLEHAVASVLEQGKSVAVIVPTQGQVQEASDRWSARGYLVKVVHVTSPFEDRQKLINQLKEDEKVIATDSIIYDCFGFGSDYITNLSGCYHGPTFVARVLVAKLLVGIFPEDELKK